MVVRKLVLKCTQGKLYMFMSCHETTGQNHCVQGANKSLESVVKLKYLGMTVTNENCIFVDDKSRLNLGNACYHAIQNVLSKM
jgi:hypothetical protein